MHGWAVGAAVGVWICGVQSLAVLGHNLGRMVRCPHCGLRLRESEPVCREHGVVTFERAALAQSAGAGAPPSVAAPFDLQFEVPGYRRGRELGRGGFGVVYEAVREGDGRAVALKVALPGQLDAEAQLASEAALLQAVGPPHVPAVLEHGQVQGHSYLALELIVAPTLADVLVEAAGPIALARFEALALGLLETVQAIHERGYAHLDLKPENIFVPHTGPARIIDFGLSRARWPPPAGSSETPLVSGAGTAEYMSPEQCGGSAELDPRSDIYSLGLLFFEILCGSPPFWGSAADVREAQRSRRPSALVMFAASDGALSRTISRCLAKRPRDRFQDVAALREALVAALAGPRAGAETSLSRSGYPGPIRSPTSLKPVPASCERRALGLLFFESQAGLGRVNAAVTAAGGHTARADGQQYVAAFGHDLGDNPARLALVAGQRLVLSKLSERCVVDVEAVSMHTRPGGSQRVFSPIFTQKERFPSATDPAGVLLTSSAVHALTDLEVTPIEGSSRWALGSSDEHARAGVTAFGLRGSTLVGRDALLSHLTESAARALDHSEPTLVSVTGQAGHGKTRLASAIVERLVAWPRSAEVVRLSGHESAVGSVGQTLPQLLRRVLGLPEQAPADGGWSLLLPCFDAGVGESAWVAVAFSLGWIETDHPEVKLLLAAAGALRFAVARGAGEALRVRARHRPLVVVVDDAHLVDAATLDALEYATMGEGQAPIWACVLVPPSFSGTRPNWGMRAGRVDRLDLTPLLADDAIALTRQLLLPVEYVPPQALSRLAERAQGVPGLLVELVRGLKRDGLVRRSERGTGYYLASDELDNLPDVPVLQWNTSREVGALSPDLAGHARLCAVLDSHFALAELAGVVALLDLAGHADDAPLDALVGLEGLVGAGILVCPRHGVYRFRHTLLRDALYQHIPEPHRVLLHKAAYQFYQTLEMADEERVPRYARHAARAFATEAAATTYLALAERMLQTQAYLEAQAAFGHALDNLTDDDPRMIVASRGRGRVRFRLGRHEDALTDLRRARKLAEPLGNAGLVAELMLDEATVLDWTRDLTESAELVRAAASLVANAPGLMRVQLAVAQARIHHRRREHEECVRVGTEAAAHALEYAEEGYEPRMIALLLAAPDCASLGRLDEAEHYFAVAIAEAQAHSDLIHLQSAYANRVLLWFARLDTVRLAADLREAVRVAREVGSPLLEWVPATNDAEVAYALGDLERARSCNDRAVFLTTHLWGDDAIVLNGRDLLLSRVALYEGELGEAQALVDRIRARLGRQGQAAAAQPDCNPALLEMVELGACHASEAAWQRFEERAPEVSLQPHEEVEIIEARALCAYRNGRIAESREAFQRALRLCVEKPNLLVERVKRRFGDLFGILQS